MQLHEAILESGTRQGYRPYYSVSMHPLRQKYIVSNFTLEGTYVVWADTFKFVQELAPSERHKLHGYCDWEPVNPKDYQTEIDL